MSEEFEMKKYFPAIDEEKLARMYAIRQRYDRGEIALAEAQELMKTQVVSITPEEYAYAEQKFNPITDDTQNECQAEDLRGILEVFGDTLKITRPTLPEGHPIDTYYREDEALRQVIEQMRAQEQLTFIKNQWLELMDKLAQIKIHYSRKQNQLYSALERKGFTHPSTAMWTYDDHNRDLINAAREHLDADRYDDFLAALPQIYTDVSDLISKEETILLPVALRMISEEEFLDMRSGDDEIGYCLIARPEGFRPQPEEKAAVADRPEGFAAELQALLDKYKPTQNEVLDVAQGKLTLEQINLLYQHMPVDFSFVDEHEIVKFYTDTKHRVFPRSKGVIGREVRHCHPPKSVHIVEEIIDKFRSGEKDFVEFWINKPEVFIYITYTAVRDKEGRFRGVLEMMQDCTHIRSLEGSRTLLTWDNENKDQAATASGRPDATTTEGTEEETVAHEDKAQTGGVLLSAETKLADLLNAYPQLKTQLKDIHGTFAAVTNPILWRLMKHKARIQDMADRSGLSVEEIVTKIKEKLK